MLCWHTFLKNYTKVKPLNKTHKNLCLFICMYVFPDQLAADPGVGEDEGVRVQPRRLGRRHRGARL